MWDLWRHIANCWLLRCVHNTQCWKCPHYQGTVTPSPDKGKFIPIAAPSNKKKKCQINTSYFQKVFSLSLVPLRKTGSLKIIIRWKCLPREMVTWALRKQRIKLTSKRKHGISKRYTRRNWYENRLGKCLRGARTCLPKLGTWRVLTNEIALSERYKITLTRMSDYWLRKQKQTKPQNISSVAGLLE